MRVLLVAAVLMGLVPGLGEVVEGAIHYASTGHLPHSAGETDLGHQGPEHSCGVTLHSCGCCTSQPVVSELDGGLLRRSGPTVTQLRGDARDVLERAPARPFRPPIA
jgi:hypothetical protein